MKLLFDTQRIQASFLSPSGNNVQHEIEVRTSPITFRTCRITHVRLKEKDPGTEKLPPEPPEADNPENCPFCHPQLLTKTPMIDPGLYPNGRMRQGESVLFPNPFPYGKYSAVSLFDNDHFVEIGKATLQSYVNSFKNCAGYLKKVLEFDRHAIHIAINRISGSFWEDLSKGILNAQRFYRSLFRNGYNLGILSIEDESDSLLELRCVMLVRSNYAPWARNDHTGFEVMLGDMATFSSPEETARKARRFWV